MIEKSPPSSPAREAEGPAEEEELSKSASSPKVASGLTPPRSPDYSSAAKSLMEEEEDDEDEGENEQIPVDQLFISRNPSLLEEEELLRSNMEERKGPDLQILQEDESSQSSQQHRPPTTICSPTEALCQGDMNLPLIPGCQGQTLAEQIDFMTVS